MLFALPLMSPKYYQYCRVLAANPDRKLDLCSHHWRLLLLEDLMEE
jgi:hypothetical protein